MTLRFCKSVLCSLSFWLSACPLALAQTTDYASEQSEEVNILNASACERVKSQETVASIRLRATDKATFNAVKSLNYLSSVHDKFSDHDFNVLIYKIVDNYVEDLSVKTTQQNEQKICVEISGYVSTDNILLALAEVEAEHNTDNFSTENSAENSSIETDFVTDESNISVETSDDSSDAKNLIEDDFDTINNTPASVTTDPDTETLLFIAPLEFYNNTSSSEYVKILNRLFDQNAYFQLTEDRAKADLVIYSKVLRAKVDAINSNTNRLQMVVSVEVKNLADDSSYIEHQNRFILFKSSEDEQKVAAGLMQKLLTKAGKLVLNKAERMAQRLSRSDTEEEEAFITPKKINPAPLGNVPLSDKASN